MLRWRIRSALYIDFENVPLPPDAIAGWLAWLEDGAFDPDKRRRRFLQKRVYWNSHAERSRDIFHKHGFLPILVGKYSGLKNGADIRMAMDVVEATYTRPEIDEFILLTGDSDFVPVLERLRAKSKRSAIVATEHRPNIHTTYHRSADLIIPSRRLTEAAQYVRPRSALMARLRLAATSRPSVAKTAQPSVVSARAIAGASQRSEPRGSPVSRARQSRETDPVPVLETAARNVVKLLMQQPRNYVAQKRVLVELDRVPGFKRQGPTAYLGAGSYKALMTELTRIEPRITVVEQPGGGTGIVFIPPPAEPTPDTSPPPAVHVRHLGLSMPDLAAAPSEPPDTGRNESLAPVLDALAREEPMAGDDVPGPSEDREAAPSDSIAPVPIALAPRIVASS
jgi:hypothetical protein